MSSYIALYRKWRPATFEDVIGQEHITDVLRGEIVRKSVSHAYLFCGSRGTGKTTCAKILAKAVSCDNPKNGDPCGECEMCKRSAESFDIAEIDAASNNGVDNIRELREEVMYPPSEMKRRVYIIDEVHMLSTGAFNALLKTLEEPPEHAMFILATTELNKIPATILSRCKRFDFHRITPDNISKRLKFICNEENIKMTDGAIMLIARLAGGAMRDALSMLELFVGRQEEIDEETCARGLGVIGRGPVMKLLEAISENDCAKALSVIADAYNGSKDMGVLLSETAQAMRDMLIIKYTNNPEKFIEGSGDIIDSLRKCAEKFTRERLLYSTEIIEQAQNRMTRTSFSRRAVLEGCIIRLCDVKLWTLPESLSTRIAELEERIASGNISVQSPANKSEKADEPLAKTKDNDIADKELISASSEEKVKCEETEKEPVQKHDEKPDNHLETKNQEKASENKKVADLKSSEKEPLSAMPEILEELRVKDKICASLLSGAKGYMSESGVVISVSSFAEGMLRNDSKKRELVIAVTKKLIGDVDVRITTDDKKAFVEEWDL